MKSERGAAALVVAISMLVLMGFAALVVDIGAGFNERAQDQSAADAGAMAGASSYIVGAEAVRDEVMAYVDSNVSATITDTDWEDCVDLDRPLNYVPVPATMPPGLIDCISIGNGIVRVRVPNQSVPTTFARALGFTDLQASATAESKLFPNGKAGVLPFGILGSASDGTELCLSGAPGGIANNPCDGSASGNFGTLNSPLLGSDDYGTAADCGTPGDPELSQNIAVGVDHLIGANDYYSALQSGAPPNQEPKDADLVWGPWQKDECAVEPSTGLGKPSDGAPIDTMNADTGYPNKAISDGLVNNSKFTVIKDSPFPPGGTPSRLQQGLSDEIEVVDKFETWSLDNVGLWDYLIDIEHSLLGIPTGLFYGTDAPSACDPDTKAYTDDVLGPGWPGDAATNKIRDCLTQYASGGYSAVIFSEGILKSPRFAFAPQFWFSDWGSGKHYQPIQRFRAIFLSGVWFNKTVYFYPGESDAQVCDNCSNPKQLEVDQVAGWLLPDDSLPAAAYTGTDSQFDPYSATLFK